MIDARHLDLGNGGKGRPVSVPAMPVADGDASGGQIQERWKQLGEQKQDLDALEKGIIEDALESCGGIVARTARVLGVPRTGLISRMATLDIDPEQFKSLGA